MCLSHEIVLPIIFWHLAHLVPPLARRERAEADMDKFRERSEQAADRARAREETATAHLGTPFHSSTWLYLLPHVPNQKYRTSSA